VVCRETCTEGSETAKSGTDEQKRYMRHKYLGKQPHHCKAQRIQKSIYVDTAVIGGREKHLPGEVLSTTCSKDEKSAEVIVVAENEPIKIIGGLTKQ